MNHSVPKSQRSPSEGRGREAGFVPLLIVILVWITVIVTSFQRYQPAPVRPAEAAENLFSAERAELFFDRLYRNATPHPAGNNLEFRQQVIAEFERLGYSVELQHARGVPQNDRSSNESVSLVNLIVFREGSTQKPPVMLAAHFDSHPDGPGAGDDGVGVCVILEIARMLRNEPAPERSVYFLLTDGEEFGLLGAREFVDHHDLADQIAAVINLEARGTSGPSLMFETSEHSRWLVDAFAKTSQRPFTSSLFHEIYKYLPNDTDFSVFREHGIPGFNFAFIGDVKNYHTPNDNFETVDRRSLQHHGDNALNLIRELADGNLEEQTGGQAVYFDLFGWCVVRWPAGLSLEMTAIGLVLVGWFWRWRRDESETGSPNLPAFIFSLFTGVIVILAVALFGNLQNVGYTLDAALDNPFPDQPFPVQASYWTWGTTVLFGLGWTIRDRVRWRTVWFGVWMLWALLAIATSIWLTGACYLFIVPLLLTGHLALAAVLTLRPASHAIFVSVGGAIVTGIVWLPMERLFYDAVGFTMNSALIIRVAFVLSTLVPVVVITKRQTLLPFLLVTLLASVGLTLWAVCFN